MEFKDIIHEHSQEHLPSFEYDSNHSHNQEQPYDMEECQDEDEYSSFEFQQQK